LDVKATCPSRHWIWWHWGWKALSDAGPKDKIKASHLAAHMPDWWITGCLGCFRPRDEKEK